VRTIVAFLVAPMLPALLPAWSASQNGSYHPLAVFVVVCGAFYALQILVGVPAWLLLRRLKLQQIWFYAVIGFVSVALPFVVYAESRSPSHDVGQALYLAIYLGLLGGLSAAIFWLIVRPNRAG
jgi:hypothetical protein